jgi:hypothetical protein
MPCHHKFIRHLNLQQLDFEPETLIVGTFNPDIDGNQAEWFYGRVANNYFWDVLPRIYGEDSLRNGFTHHNWKGFCNRRKIAITDLITSVNDADLQDDAHRSLLLGYGDNEIANNFHDFTYTNIVGLLQENENIQNIYLTRQAGNMFYDNLWQPVYDHCIASGKFVKTLLTPSASARFQIGNFRNLHPDDQTPLRNFIMESWEGQWHF